MWLFYLIWHAEAFRTRFFPSRLPALARAYVCQRVVTVKGVADPLNLLLRPLRHSGGGGRGEWGPRCTRRTAVQGVRVARGGWEITIRDGRCSACLVCGRYEQQGGACHVSYLLIVFEKSYENRSLAALLLPSLPRTRVRRDSNEAMAQSDRKRKYRLLACPRRQDVSPRAWLYLAQ